MADVTLANTLLAGIPSMIVAVVGVGGVIYTQRRADARQDRIAAANRHFDRESRLLDTKRELAAEFVAAAWLLASAARDFILDDGDYSDLTPKETATVRRTLSQAAMVLDPAGRKAIEAVFEALLAYVGDWSQEKWDAISEAEDKLIAVINGEASPREDGAGPSPGCQP
ncbi:hypothetical protein [Mycolicibacter minnesotensis]